MDESKGKGFSRRDFLAAGTAAGISGFPLLKTAKAQAAKPVRVGVLGTGGRGIGACADALGADPNVEIVAMADLAPDRIELALQSLSRNNALAGDGARRIKVTDKTKFSGWDCHEKLLATDIDYVILSNPPAFRPRDFALAVERGKHIFAEKPLATDPVGVRKIRDSARLAKQKGLSVVVGLNARHSKKTMETVKRVRDGQIGQISSGYIHRLAGGLWHRGSNPAWTEMEYQCRNWYYFYWLSGDQIVEMVIHQIDTMNWLMGAHPVSALASGGRQVRVDPKYGNIYDHMDVDFEYPGGVHVFCMLRQWDGCANKISSVVIGPNGASDSKEITGKNPWKGEDDVISTLNYEHWELMDSMRKGQARNDILDFGADSTLTCIMGREAAYTGKLVTWDEMLNSSLDLFPKEAKLGPAPQHPIPMPGQPRNI